MKKPCLHVVILLLLALPSLGNTAERPPNILFILTDDQAPETLSAYGNTVCQTPHLDRLAAEGITIDGAHHMGSWSGAVCRPSRTMIMTGRSVWHIPGKGSPHHDNPALVPPGLAEQSLPAVFNRAGYETFRTCKKGNSYPPANALFQTVRDMTRREGNNPDGSAWHADQVLEYLHRRAQTPAKKPFLIYFGFSHPHDPRNGTPELLKKYGATNSWDPENPPEANPKAPPLPPNWLPAHPFPHGHPTLRDEERVQGVMTRRDPATVRNELGREYACIENIDQQIGRVLAQLESMGELDNTYVFFTADHGIAVGRHGLMGKQNLYEHTWKVPFIARGPGIAPGTRAQGNLYLMDVLPTLCDVAQIPIPSTVEGKSFRAVLEGKQHTIRDVVYGVYAGGTKPGIRAVKEGHWKLIKYDTMNGDVRRTQLFNLATNPLELLSDHHDPSVRSTSDVTPAPGQLNLADDPEFREKRAYLEALLAAEMKRLDDPFPLWNPQP